MKSQNIYWSWTDDEEICLFGEDGKIIFSAWPGLYANYEAVLSYASRDSYRNPDSGYVGKTPWEKAKEFTRQNGITPTNVAKKFNGIVYQEVISRHPNWASIVKTKRGRIKNSFFYTITSSDLVDQAIKDGLKNIAPLIIMFNESPKELKKRFGDSNWKALCRNSYSRNRLILQAVYREDVSTSMVLNCNRYPSTLLKSGWHRREYEALMLALKEANCSMAKMSHQDYVRTIVKVCDTWRDTKMMCEARDIPFNPKWSWRRIQEEHHRMTDENRRQFLQMQALRDAELAKLLEVDFRTLHKGLDTVVFPSGVLATPLINMEQVQAEGDKMHHCVGSYARMCASGDYLVWNVKKGPRESTLGIQVLKPAGKIFRDGSSKQYVFSQHYHACNQVIQDEDLIAASIEIVKMLNEKNKVEKVLDRELVEA